jgi:hypothetical protein
LPLFAWAFVGVLVVAAWAIAALLAENDKNATRTQAESDVQKLALALAEQTGNFVGKIDQALRTAKFVFERDPAGATIAELALRRTFPAEDLVQFAVADAEGIIRQSNLPLGPAPVSIRDREHFAVQIERDVGLFVSKPVFGRVSAAARPACWSLPSMPSHSDVCSALWATTTRPSPPFSDTTDSSARAPVSLPRCSESTMARTPSCKRPAEARRVLGRGRARPTVSSASTPIAA